MPDVKSTREKSLELNLDPHIYGTIAEIGAGQEVSRNFFQVGAASGTVAKTISAYDKIVSDTIYGKEDSGRYVCESRLIKMLGREFGQLFDRLTGHRDEKSTFFAFANTIATTGYKSSGEGHGWLGVRFQGEAGQKGSDLIIHCRLKDNEAVAQQFVVGTLGINMIHSCFQAKNMDPKAKHSHFVSCLLDNIDPRRIEIDMIKVDGEAFCGFDNRLLSLELVKQGMTEAVFFDVDGSVIQPSDLFYKKNILVMRGSFRPPTLVTMDMLKCGLSEYQKLTGAEEKDVVSLAEITMSNLKTWGDVDGQDFLARVDLLGDLGLRVMISNYERYYRLSTYFQNFTKRPVGMVMGIYNFKELLNEEHYKDLPGGILESFGVILNHEDKLLIYPYKEKGGNLLTSHDLEIPEKYKFLFQHLHSHDLLVDMQGANSEILHIYSRRVLTMIQNGEEGWEKMVPESVLKTIKKSALFS